MGQQDREQNFADLLNLDAFALINAALDTKDYIQPHTLNTPPVCDPPDNLAYAFEQVIDDPISRGETVVPLFDQVVLPAGTDWDLSCYAQLPEDAWSNMPSPLTVPSSNRPLTTNFDTSIPDRLTPVLAKPISTCRPLTVGSMHTIITPVKLTLDIPPPLTQVASLTQFNLPKPYAANVPDVPIRVVGIEETRSGTPTRRRSSDVKPPVSNARTPSGSPQRPKSKSASKKKPVQAGNRVNNPVRLLKGTQVR